MSETRLIHGFHAITAKLRHSAGDVKEITVAEGRQDGRMRDLLKLAEAHGVRVILSDAKRLDGLAGGSQHQGVVAKVAPQAKHVTPDRTHWDLLLERVHDLRVRNNAAIVVGDASYVLYLIHGYVVFGVHRTLIGKRQFSELTGQLVGLGLIAVATVAAILVYRFYEQPILRLLKKYLIKKRKISADATRA